MKHFLKALFPFVLFPITSFGHSLSSQQEDTLKFAVVTDTHIGKPGNDAGLAAIVQDINDNPEVDFVLHAGDVSDFGYDDQLGKAKSLMEELNKPYFIVPGNHDTAWSGSGGIAYNKLWKEQKFVTDIDGVRFIGVSTGPYGRMSRGYVPLDQLQWLDSLAAVTPKHQPVILLTHYPIDENLSNYDELLEKLRKLHTLAIFCGHGHANKVFDFGGIKGIMSRTAQSRQGTVTYNTVYLTNDSIYVKMVEVGEPTDMLWATVPVTSEHDRTNPPAAKKTNAPINPALQGVQALWIHQDNGNIVSTPAVWKNNVLVGNLAGEFRSLDAGNATVNWTFRAGQPIYASPEVAGNKVVFASADSSVYCLRARTGKLIWKVKTGGPVLASPVIKDNRVYIGSSDLTFRALDLKTGKAVWVYEGLAGFPPGKPAVAEGKVVFGTWGKTLYALNRNDGTLAWEWKNDAYSHYYSPAMAVPVIQNGKVYMVAPDEKLREFDLNTGKQTFISDKYRVRESLGGSAENHWLLAKTMQDTIVAWSTQGSIPETILHISGDFGRDFSPSMPAFEGSMAYFGTTYGRVYAVDMKEKKVKWIYQLSKDMVNTVRPLPGGKVLATSVDGKVSLLEVHEL